MIKLLAIKQIKIHLTDGNSNVHLKYILSKNTGYRFTGIFSNMGHL